MSIRYLTIKELKSLLEKKEISISEIINYTKENFKNFDKEINSSIEIFDEIENISDEYKNEILYGIPCLIKDVISQKNRNLTCSSKILQGYKSTYDATVVSRLKKNGSILMGRANCDEFAMGSSNETSFYGPVKNPHDLTKVAGGSSGGSAAAVAAGFVPFSLGSETGGSIRQPASFCGIVGLKPTYGSVSRFGLVAYASSLDQIGIFSRNVYDNALVYSSISGKDPRDSSSKANYEKKNFFNNLDSSNPKDKKIGVINNAMNAEGINPKIKSLLEDVLKKYEKAGAIIEYIDLPTMEYSAAIYIILSRAEAASNLSRFDGVKYGYRSNDYSDLLSMYKNTRYEGFGQTVRKRIILGNYVLSSGYADEYYKKAKEIQSLMKEEYLNALNKYDFLFSPVSPEPAFGLGEMDKNPLAIDLQDYFTAAANLVGIPGLSIPCGFVDNLPVSFQIMGNYFSEELLFQMGHWFEKN